MYYIFMIIFYLLNMQISYYMYAHPLTNSHLSDNIHSKKLKSTHWFNLNNRPIFKYANLYLGNIALGMAFRLNFYRLKG